MFYPSGATEKRGERSFIDIETAQKVENKTVLCIFDEAVLKLK